MSFLDNLDFSGDSGTIDFFSSQNEGSDLSSSAEEETVNAVFLAKLDDLKSGIGDFYQSDCLADKTFSQEGKSDIPDNLISVLMTKKKGADDVQFKTKAEHAHLIDQLNNINLHARNNEGQAVVQPLNHRNFTVGTMTDAEYERIHNAAMRSLASLANQYKEHTEKTELDSPSPLASRSLSVETGKEERKLPVGGLFPTQVPDSSGSRSSVETEQLMDERAFQQDAIRKEHVEQADDAHQQRLDEHKYTSGKQADVLKADVLKTAINAIKDIEAG